MGLASGRFLTIMLQESTTAGGSGGFNVPELIHLVVVSVIFVAIGLLVFGLAFWLITKLSPFSIRKEIEEDQNTALGIVIGSVIIGLAIIIAAAIG
jgi:putative membrane protein